MRDAPVSDLAAVGGVGPALAERIKQAIEGSADLTVSNPRLHIAQFVLTFDEAGEHLRFMPNPVIAKCPICAEALSVARLECASCGTRIEGSFALGRFHQLSAEQLEFLETFIKARGNFKDVERELDAVIRALGFPSQAEPDRETERRKEIRRELAEGRIAPDDAASLLEREPAT